MKKLLIVNTAGFPGLKMETIANTELVIVTSFEEAFEQLKSRYAFDGAAWDAKHPHAPTPVQTPHFLRAKRRREAELETRLPYWDAIIFYIESRCDVSLGISIGCAAIAAASGCKFIKILEFSSASFNWYPLEGPHDRWIRLCVNNVEVVVTRCYHQRDYHVPLANELQRLILVRKGYDGCLNGTHTIPSREGLKPMPAKEFFESVWPGLFQSET